MKNIVTGIGLISFAFMITTIGTVQAEVMTRVGYAYDKQTGKFLYSETHHEVKQNGRVAKATVTYRDARGKVFAEKYIDYKKSLVMPDFHLVNEENGHVEGARDTDEKLRIHFRPDSDAKVKETYVETPRNGIIDAGFDRFIEQNWTALVNGETLEREFLIPSQLDFYTFEIRRTTEQPAGELVFELRIKSVLLQMVVSPVLVHYDARTRALLRYEGISNIRDYNGDNFDVRIEFPQPGQVQVRVPSDAPLDRATRALSPALHGHFTRL